MARRRDSRVRPLPQQTEKIHLPEYRRRVLSESPMRRFSLILTLTAWLFATGSHWDLVQTFGWGRMIASYARTMPLSEAIRLTFTADNLCSVCEFVQESKQSQGNMPVPGGQADTKILLVYQPAPAIIVSAPSYTSWRLGETRVSGTDRGAPPTPPPRAA